MNCELCEVLKLKQTPLINSKYWQVILSNDQGYFGKTLINLKKHKTSVSQLNQEEWFELLEIIKNLDQALDKTIESELLNISCLMNNAFKSNPPNPHVHWHIIPRHRKPITFNNINIVDEKFGHHYDKSVKKLATNEELEEITKLIKNNL